MSIQHLQAPTAANFSVELRLAMAHEDLDLAEQIDLATATPATLITHLVQVCNSLKDVLRISDEALAYSRHDA